LKFVDYDQNRFVTKNVEQCLVEPNFVTLVDLQNQTRHLVRYEGNCKIQKEIHYRISRCHSRLNRIKTLWSFVGNRSGQLRFSATWEALQNSDRWPFW
jgi:hypothetical protein